MQTNDGTLISLILGGKIPDTSSIKRGRVLEDEVRKTIERKLKKKNNKCGLILNSKYPMIAGSPDGIFEDGIIEIKCPISAKTCGEATAKYNAQMQIQIMLDFERKPCNELLEHYSPKFQQMKDESSAKIYNDPHVYVRNLIYVQLER
ncbi:hypothetical protein NQ317_003886 [Molorchus minor]|uniref:YqaJ viral recombinase domain-containing protein n=1 Tax=Molorchus minor TaxID=1323400 RepID=A0ABQ9IRQ4_9CUCU|nr:hypothetical protein NQ317_003886 [Molorchus minor]